MNKSINQYKDWKCKYASVINALELQWVIQDPQKELDLVQDWLGTMWEVEKYFKEKGFITWLQKIKHFQIKIFLRKWIPVCTGINGYKKSSIMTPPYILEFEDRIGSHAFVMLSYDESTKLYKCENSWWEKYQYFYLRESDIRKLITPFICIPSIKNISNP